MDNLYILHKLNSKNLDISSELFNKNNYFNEFIC